MTHDLLTLLSSTVASNTTFSASNRQMNERRSSLSLDILKCQICLKNWDDANYQIQHKVTKDSYVLEYFKHTDLLDKEENENNN